MIINIFDKKIRYEEIEKVDAGKPEEYYDTLPHIPSGASIVVRPSKSFQYFKGEKEEPCETEILIRHDNFPFEKDVHYYYYPDRNFHELEQEIKREAKKQMELNDRRDDN